MPLFQGLAILGISQLPIVKSIAELYVPLLPYVLLILFLVGISKEDFNKQSSVKSKLYFNLFINAIGIFLLATYTLVFVLGYLI
jgi:hypothetical protein